MGAREVRAGGAYVEVSTKDSTDKGLAGIKSKLTSFGQGIARVGGVALGVGSAAAGAAAAAVMKAVDMGSTIKDMADRFGLSYLAVQQLGYAADLSGSSLDSMINGIKKMQQGLGNGTLTDDLAKIGVTLEQIKGLAPDKQFMVIAEAIGRISDPSQRTAVAMKIFGKAGTDLIPMLSGGKDGVNALVAEFDRLGIAMSDEAVAQADKLGDEIDNLTKRFGAMATQIGVSLIPVVEALMKRLETAAPHVVDFIGHGEGTIAQIKKEGWNNPLQMALGARSGGDRGAANLALKAESDAHAKAVRERAMASVDVDNFNAARRRAGLRSPILEFLEDAEKRLRRMNSNREGRERGEIMKDILGGVMADWRQIGRGVERDQRREQLRDLRAMQKELANIGSGTGTFGTFDKRDIAGGAYLSVSQKQLDVAKRTNELLEEIKKKKAGLGVM